MSTTAYQIGPVHYASSAQSAELFPDSIKAALDRLEEISKNAQPNEVRPTAQDLEWAKKVLLRVLPRYYLVGAEIDVFQGEIHVNWEHGNKRVTVFLPAQNELKIYCERDTPQGVEHHLRREAVDPWEVSGVLRWLFT